MAILRWGGDPARLEANCTRDAVDGIREYVLHVVEQASNRLDPWRGPLRNHGGAAYFALREVYGQLGDLAALLALSDADVMAALAALDILVNDAVDRAGMADVDPFAPMVLVREVIARTLVYTARLAASALLSEELDVPFDDLPRI